MKFSLFAAFLLLSLTTRSVVAVSLDSVVSIAEGSVLRIHLSDAELLGSGKKTWPVVGASWNSGCELSIRSHYDSEQARVSDEVIYYVSAFNSQNSTDPDGDGWIRDQFNAWLTTDNKDLPLLNFSCFQDVKRDAPLPKKFTFGYVSELISQPNFFSEVVPAFEYSLTAFDLLPTVQYLEVGEPLHFKADKDPDGSLGSFETPRIRDGRLIGRDDPKNQCFMIYEPPRFDAYDVTLNKGEKWSLNTFYQVSGNSYTLGADSMSARLSVTCEFDKPIQNFSEFRKVLGSIVEIY
jgi:hypothetical protein